MKPLSCVIIGCGSRGSGFSHLLKNMPHLGHVTAVADPREDRRNAIAGLYNLPSNAKFANWTDLLARPRFADVAFVTTMDRDHAAPAIAALAAGYHVFLEKPMAASLEDCQAIEAAQRKSGKVLSVCHSLRYNSFFDAVHRVVQEDTIGEIVTMDQLEGVQYEHYSHSFTRAHWARAATSSFMLMAKSCHDIDYVHYMIDRPCERVSSFGSLTHFTRANAPKGATERCTDGCPHEPECPYSTYKTYMAHDGWAGHIMTDLSKEGRLKFLQTQPAGRCVYRCDNDVVDHQVVNMEFQGGITATFTMTAFTQEGGRRIRIHGTKGDLVASEARNHIEVRTYCPHQTYSITPAAETGGHGGGDDRTLRAFMLAAQAGDPKAISTSAQASLESHTIVFAAEKARLEKRVVEMSEL